MKTKDMLFTRQEIIDECLKLGERFIEHFQKIIKEPEAQSVNHWINEMQSWLNSVKKLTFKPNSKLISYDQLYSWFFTAGSSVDILFPYEIDERSYNTFLRYVGIDYSVKNALIKAKIIK